MSDIFAAQDRDALNEAFWAGDDEMFGKLLSEAVLMEEENNTTTSTVIANKDVAEVNTVILPAAQAEISLPTVTLPVMAAPLAAVDESLTPPTAAAVDDANLFASMTMTNDFALDPTLSDGLAWDGVDRLGGDYNNNAALEPLFGNDALDWNLNLDLSQTLGPDLLKFDVAADTAVDAAPAPPKVPVLWPTQMPTADVDQFSLDDVSSPCSNHSFDSLFSERSDTSSRTTGRNHRPTPPVAPPVALPFGLPVPPTVVQPLTPPVVQPLTPPVVLPTTLPVDPPSGSNKRKRTTQQHANEDSGTAKKAKKAKKTTRTVDHTAIHDPFTGDGSSINNPLNVDAVTPAIPSPRRSTPRPRQKPIKRASINGSPFRGPPVRGPPVRGPSTNGPPFSGRPVRGPTISGPSFQVPQGAFDWPPTMNAPLIGGPSPYPLNPWLNFPYPPYPIAPLYPIDPFSFGGFFNDYSTGTLTNDHPPTTSSSTPTSNGNRQPTKFHAPTRGAGRLVAPGETPQWDTTTDGTGKGLKRGPSIYQKQIPHKTEIGGRQVDYLMESKFVDFAEVQTPFHCPEARTSQLQDPNEYRMAYRGIRQRAHLTDEQQREYEEMEKRKKKSG
ncbi:MAG: hypothetical protein M1817_001663 [Caeruleum heppii]|nr:MAG: hypothetical protein M1817_001663 [Caeruleum heppii]